MRPVDSELPRPERTEALDLVFRHVRIIRVAAAVPTPRGKPPERLVNARDPGFLRSPGVAHQAAREQLREFCIERGRQRFDQGRLAHIAVEYREVAVELQACREQRAAVP